MGTWLRSLWSRPVLQNQEYEHPRDLAACCGSCRNVSCLFTFPNGTTSLFLVCSPLTTHLGGHPRRQPGSGLGTDRVLGSTCAQELCPVCSLRPSSHPVPIVHLCALQPGASWIANCTRHHCGNTPLGAVLVRSPISCPPLNETECAKVSASLLPSQHGLKPGVSPVLLAGGVAGWGAPVCRSEGRGVPWRPYLPCHPSSTSLHVPALTASHPTSSCVTHTAAHGCMQTYILTCSETSHTCHAGAQFSPLML